MAAILCMITGMTAVPAYAAAPETFGAVPGWNQISGKWYYLMENGAWSTDFIEDENTCYTFTKDGTLSYARKTPNTQGGAYPVYVLDQKEQELFDDMNDEKSDLFFDTYPETEDDYDNGDVEFYDGRATFVLDMDLCDIAKARLSSAMEKGYCKSKNTIPGEGTVSDYVKTAFPERKSATFLRCTSGALRRHTIRMILS